MRAPRNRTWRPAPSPGAGRAGSRPGIAAALLLATAATGCGGHLIRADRTDNYTSDFDFGSTTCAAPSPAPDAGRERLDVQFLGVSGLYFRWRGAGVLTAPYFSRASLLRVAFGRGHWDRPAIAEGLREIPSAPAAILVAHSHHDHLFDLPVVAADRPEARIYVNRSAALMLESYPEIQRRTTILDPESQEWIQLTDARGKRSPIRILALPSPHAPQAPGIHWADGDIARPWRSPWDRVPLRRFASGRPMALVIDLLTDDGATAFRIYFQDAATLDAGLTPRHAVPALAGRPVDLAVLCMASHQLAAGFPQRLLDDLQPRHVLATHYEDFFRRRGRAARFAPLLTNRRADQFLVALGAFEPRPPRPRLAPLRPPCGPAGARWTMPVPGEWLSFSVDPGR